MAKMVNTKGVYLLTFFTQLSQFNAYTARYPWDKPHAFSTVFGYEAVMYWDVKSSILGFAVLSLNPHNGKVKVLIKTNAKAV